MLFENLKVGDRVVVRNNNPSSSKNGVVLKVKSIEQFGDENYFMVDTFGLNTSDYGGIVYASSKMFRCSDGEVCYGSRQGNFKATPYKWNTGVHFHSYVNAEKLRRKFEKQKSDMFKPLVRTKEQLDFDRLNSILYKLENDVLQVTAGRMIGDAANNIEKIKSKLRSILDM